MVSRHEEFSRPDRKEYHGIRYGRRVARRRKVFSMTILERAQLSQLRVKYALGIELAGDELKILLRLERQTDEDGQPSIEARTDANALTSD